MAYLRCNPSFSSKDEKEKYVFELLDIAGRKKSKIITEAMLCYISKNNVEDMPLTKKQKILFKDKINNSDFIQNVSNSNISECIPKKIEKENSETNTEEISQNNDNIDNFLDALDLF